MDPDPYGEWVRYEDYARLAAELKLQDEANDILTRQLKEARRTVCEQIVEEAIRATDGESYGSR